MTLGNVQAPFLQMTSFIAEETPSAVFESQPVGSPFVSVYEMEGDADTVDPAREAFTAIANELYDEEFDEAITDLVIEARSMHQEALASGSDEAAAERVVTEHLAQLTQASEAIIDGMARRLGPQVQPGRESFELNEFVGSYTPPANLDPAFENFLGKLIKKVAKGVRSVAGTAWNAAKKMGAGLVLDKIKGLIKPLLNNVLQKAIGKLPEAVQPLAQQLARKLGLAAPAEPASAPAEPGSPVQDSPAATESELQWEFNTQLARVLTAELEVELDTEIARIRVNAAASAVPVMANLSAARELFIHELENVAEGEDTQPQIQNFLPAILPALRLGVRIIGRPKIVNFLSGLLSKLIAKLIGPAQASALSQAIVDSGLKLLSLEITDQQRAALSASAVSATVEETLTRVASLPDEVLDNQELLEAFTLEAFERAAAANLPAIFPESTYRQRPELLEAGVNAAWVMHPSRGTKRYKRCSRTFPVKITPHLAEEVESFDGVPLSEYLHDSLGLPEGAEVEAELHLFEALPGSSIDDMARGESETPGLGAADEVTLSQFHPLTPAAAANLLRARALGRPASRRHLATGQRVYYLSIPGRRPSSRRLSHLNLTLDCSNDTARVCVFLSEAKAQRMAARLRQQSHAGTLTVAFHKLITRRLAHALAAITQGHPGKHIRLIHPSVAPGQPAGKRLPAGAASAFFSAIGNALLPAFSAFLSTDSARFLAATENAADGVTLVFTVQHPSGLRAITQALSGKPAPAEPAVQPETRVDVFPGHKCD